MTFLESLNDDVAANNVGSGNILGTGEKPPDEPAVSIKAQEKLKKKNRYEEEFCGIPVFKVDPTTYDKLKFGKTYRRHWETYLKESENSDQIKEYVLGNPNKPVIIKNNVTENMMSLFISK